MKENLTVLFNALKQIETRGDSTVVMADCLRLLVKIVNDIPEEDEEK